MPRWRVPDEETLQLPAHRDMRSASRALNRLRKQSQKYYGYRSVHPSWIGQTYLDWTVSWQDEDGTPSVHGAPFTDLFILPQVHVARAQELVDHEPLRLRTKITGDDCTLTVRPAVWEKADMFLERESDIYPLDRRHHISKRRHVRDGQRHDLQERGKGMKQRHRDLAWEGADNSYCIQSVYDFDLAGLQGPMPDPLATSLWGFNEPADSHEPGGGNGINRGENVGAPEDLSSTGFDDTEPDWTCLCARCLQSEEQKEESEAEYDFLSDIEL